MEVSTRAKTIKIDEQQLVLRTGKTPEQLTETELATVQRVTCALQTSIEIKTVLDLFAQEVIQYVAYSGIQYENDEIDFCYNIGEDSLHRCDYRLVIDQHYCGNLIYSRRVAFDSTEIQMLELLLTGLIYPLKNAIRFYKTQQSALTDILTGAGNRAALDAALEREIELAKRHQLDLSVIVIDVDNFKKINDTYGHSVGDKVLKALALDLNDSIRRSDILFRFGGEEFVIVLSNTRLEGANLLAERIRKKIESCQYKLNKETTIHVTISLGITALKSGDDHCSLFERADKALYRAKDSGKNVVYMAS